MVAIEGTSELVSTPFYLGPPVRFNKKYHSFFQHHPRVDLILGATGSYMITRGRTITPVALRVSLGRQLCPTLVQAATFVLACGGMCNQRALQPSATFQHIPVDLGL